MKPASAWLAIAVVAAAAACSPILAKEKAPATNVSAKQAAATALAKYPHGKLQGKPKLEHEDGRWQYEVLVRDGKKLMEVNVDAGTGKIVAVEETNAAEEAREKKEKGKKGEKPEKEERDEKK